MRKLSERYGDLCVWTVDHQWGIYTPTALLFFYGIIFTNSLMGMLYCALPWTISFFLLVSGWNIKATRDRRRRIEEENAKMRERARLQLITLRQKESTSKD